VSISTTDRYHSVTVIVRPLNRTHSRDNPTDSVTTNQGGSHVRRRDVKELCTRLGIEGIRLSPHGFRHHFAVQYLRRGGAFTD